MLLDQKEQPSHGPRNEYRAVSLPNDVVRRLWAMN